MSKSAAEIMRERLAKYAPKSGTPSEVLATEPRRELAVVEVRENSPAVAVSVTTDLQPTTLVVVERPVEQRSEGNSQAADDVLQASATDLDTGNPVHAGFLQRLADLEAALLNRDPLMKTHLGEIHKALIQYDEIANLLRPSEIHKIMSAQQQHTGVILRQDVAKTSKVAASKKAAKLGLNDI